MLEHVQALSCAKCGESFSPSRRARCPTCADGGALRYAYRTRELAPFDRRIWARREPWLWRFRELLPFDDDLEPPPLHIGMTPLYGSPRLAKVCGVAGLFVKDESRNPTGRIVDRAAALLVADAMRTGQVAMSGQLSPSVAAFAASAELKCAAVVEDKVTARAAEAFGAMVRLAERADLRQLLLSAQLGGHALADVPNPLAFEGLKTLGVELGDQLAERLPDVIAVDASIPQLAEAVETGLAQCVELGLFGKAPQVLAVRADAAHLPRLEEQVRESLGLPLEGVRALAGLEGAVREGRVAPGALALVVVESPVWPRPSSWTPPPPVRDYEAFRAAIDGLARSNRG